MGIVVPHGNPQPALHPDLHYPGKVHTEGDILFYNPNEGSPLEVQRQKLPIFQYRCNPPHPPSPPLLSHPNDILHHLCPNS